MSLKKQCDLKAMPGKGNQTIRFSSASAPLLVAGSTLWNQGLVRKCQPRKVAALGFLWLSPTQKMEVIFVGLWLALREKNSNFCFCFVVGSGVCLFVYFEEKEGSFWHILKDRKDQRTGRRTERDCGQRPFV